MRINPESPQIGPTPEAQRPKVERSRIGPAGPHPAGDLHYIPRTSKQAAACVQYNLPAVCALMDPRELRDAVMERLQQESPEAQALFWRHVEASGYPLGSLPSPAVCGHALEQLLADPKVAAKWRTWQRGRGLL